MTRWLRVYKNHTVRISRVRRTNVHTYFRSIPDAFRRPTARQSRQGKAVKVITQDGTWNILYTPYYIYMFT